MATYKLKEILDLMRIAGYEYLDNDNGSHQVFRHKKTGISQPIAIHGKELNSHTTESIISYVLFTSYICGYNIQDNKKFSQNILVYMNKCLKNTEKNILNIVPTDFRRRMNINSPEDVKNYIEKKRMIMNQYNAVQEIEPSM